MLIEIIKWDKFNPRKDVKATAWFRLQNTFWQDHKFFELDNDGKMVWIALLSTASQEQNGVIEINPELFAAILRVTKKKILSVFKILEEKQCVRITSELRDVDVPLQTDRQTDRQTNKQDKQTNKNAHSDKPTEREKLKSLENLYGSLYPRKVGKTKGLEKLRVSIKTYEDLKNLEKAMKNYRDHCSNENLESKFIKHFQSWASEWRDWLDPITGTSESFSQDSWTPMRDLLQGSGDL